MELQGALQVPEGALVDSYMLVILVIMILAGVLGGMANYFMSDRRVESSKRETLKYAIFGVVASLTVPLFLNMISSNLLEAARTRPIDLFVFAGFCLLFVVFSRRFFENIASRLIQQIEQIRGEVRQIKDAPPAEAVVVEPKISESQSTVRSEPPKVALTYSDIELMRTIAEGKFVYGSLSELAGEASLSKEVVTERLPVIKNMNLIELKIDEKNVLHWHLSAKGKQFLGEVLKVTQGGGGQVGRAVHQHHQWHVLRRRRFPVVGFTHRGRGR